MNYNFIQVEIDQPVRLDRYIRRCFPSVTQGLIEKALRNGKIKLNGKRSLSNIRLANGDVISYRENLFGDKLQGSNKMFSKAIIALASKILSEYLIYSSDEFIAIDKPSGIAVQGGSKIKISIDEALQYINQRDQSQYKIVHRLDKGTSGILLIAKGHSNAAKLGAAFKERLIKKKYYAVLSSIPLQKSGKLINYIDKDRSGSFEIIKEIKGGKLAETIYKVIDIKDQFAFVEFMPLTGRMHQLRFHAKFLGCPIVGDEKYGADKYDRMMLHAAELNIDKSIFGRVIQIKSDLPVIF